MDLTHMTALEVGGQQYSRPGNSDISWPNETERLFFKVAASTTISSHIDC